MRRHRESAGMSLEALGGVVSYGKSSLARFETAESMIPEDLPPALDAAFGTDGIFEKLYALARKEIHPDQFRRRMDFETKARLIQEYGGQIVPGIVQTEDYARALFKKFNPKASKEAIQELVTARMSRQSLLRGENPPDLSLILDEACLWRSFGGPAAMRAQLAKLAELTLTPTTVVQVLPFDDEGHGLVGGTLTLLTLEDGTQSAYEESISTGTLLEDMSSVVARYRAYDLLKACALSPSKSAAFIRSVMEALPQ
jgi:hypothetical protein